MQNVRWITGVACLMAASAAVAAEDAFSKAVQPADFTAAGLEKLSPQELARLDALVRDYKSGALEAARREAAAAAKAKADAEARAARAEAQAKAAETKVAEAKAEATEAKKSGPSLLQRAKVILSPGTEIEYTTVESRIVGEFRGWEGRTLFTLENGQRWQAEGTGTYISPPISGPAVKIVPGMLGSFYMVVEGVKPRVKVALVSGGK